MTPVRLTVCLTHPVQYFSPWFRHIAANRPDIDLTVIYAATPTPAQQGAGFERPLTWDADLLRGYRHVVLGGVGAGRRFDSEAFLGVDGGKIGGAIEASAPDVVLVPGWHSIAYLRAIRACRRRGVPVLYRGDSHLGSSRPAFRRPFWRARTKALLRLFDGYLAVGTRSREYLRAFGVPEPLILSSPHAIDHEAFEERSSAVTGAARRAARAARGLTEDAFVVAYAGKLQDIKRPQDLIRAARRLGSRTRLLMIGTGPLEERCRELARAEGVDVAWAGLVNQQELPATLALADCLVLPSASETWGLVVNEAMACGLPCVVSETAGCVPDLIEPGVTGETFRPGDVAGLAAAVERVRRRRREGHEFSTACRARAAAHSFEAATEGLAAACRRVLHRKGLAQAGHPGQPRILACFGGMVITSGIERMSFEVLRVLRERGAAAHCVVNRWDSSRIVALAEQSGASWSTGYYWYPFRRHTRNPIRWAQLAWDIACTSAGLLRDAWRFRPTHVFLPEFAAALRNAPALWLLRRLGVPVVLRLGNAPDQGRFYGLLWRFAIDPVVDHFVSNSRFIESELLAHGVSPDKARVVHNTAPTRSLTPDPGSRNLDPLKVIFIGQVIPPKGLDLLIDAIAVLAARGRDVRLDVVGDIDGWESPSYAGYRTGIRKRASLPDVAGRVRFLGVRDDVPALLAAAGVHCCPSRPEQREGFAVVTLEAKRAGIPSVVFPTGSLPEAVTHGEDGWICSDVTVAALVEGLDHFLADPARWRAAGEAARRSGARFGRQRFSAAWAEVFGVADGLRERGEAVA